MVKDKKYYDVKVETMIPAIITYKVLAESAEQAILLIKDKSPNHIQHKINLKKDIIIRVYDYGSSMIRYVKRVFR